MAKEQGSARKAQLAAARGERLQKERRRKLTRRVIGGAVLLTVAASAGYCVIDSRRFASEVSKASYPAAQHMAGSIRYQESPPIGGPHNVAWQSCGIYDSPIHDEHAVHSLEHGAVWITYRPDLPAADVQRLRAVAADDYMLLSPYPGLPAPVVVTAWNNQMQLTGADDPRLSQFIRLFKNNPSTTPEFGATCSGGIATTANRNTLGSGALPMGR